MAFENKISNGTDMLLSVGTDVLGASSSCSIEFTTETRDTSNKDTGDWASSEYGSKSWSMSSENFADFGGTFGYNEIFDLMDNKTKVTVKCVLTEGANTFTLSGLAIITSLPLSAPKGDNMSYSVSFQGTGALTKTKVPAA